MTGCMAVGSAKKRKWGVWGWVQVMCGEAMAHEQRQEWDGGELLQTQTLKEGDCVYLKDLSDLKCNP